MRIAMLSSEVAPWVKSGGLGDVLGALPQALAARHLDIATFCPLHRAVRAATNRAGQLLEDTGILAAAPAGSGVVEGRWYAVRQPGHAPVYFLDAPAFFDRETLYSAYTAGSEEDDDGRRFAWFCREALAAAPRLMGGPLDVVHAHDWQSAAALLLPRGRAAGVLTIHNLAFHGVFGPDQLDGLGIPTEHLHPHPHDPSTVDLLRSAILAADAVTTVSPRYAQEICTPAFGEALHEDLGERGVVGILNGIDQRTWDPRRDLSLPAGYGPDQLGGKATCRRHLLRQFGLPTDPSGPVFGVVSRMASQKGLDLVAEIVAELVRANGRLVVLGTGEPELEARFRALDARYPEHVGVRIAFSVPLSHLLIAGSDALLVPSRFEPCGLTQLYALRYGTVPVVHAVGGLADTVLDAEDPDGTGFTFGQPTAAALAAAVLRTVRLHGQDAGAWKAMQRRGMARTSSWAPSAAAYAALYQQLRG